MRKNPPATLLGIPDRSQSGDEFIIGREAYYYEWSSAGSLWWCGEWKKYKNPPKFKKTKLENGEIKITKLPTELVEKKK